MATRYRSLAPSPLASRASYDGPCMANRATSRSPFWQWWMDHQRISQSFSRRVPRGNRCKIGNATLGEESGRSVPHDCRVRIHRTTPDKALAIVDSPACICSSLAKHLWRNASQLSRKVDIAFPVFLLPLSLSFVCDMPLIQWSKPVKVSLCNSIRSIRSRLQLVWLLCVQINFLLLS